jgi:hypothetical protein
MRRSIGRTAIAVAVIACGPSPATLAPSPAPSTAAAKVVVDCETGFDQATCDKVVTAALHVVAPSGWTATHVWISSGSLAPIVDLLFDPNANFPAPLVPEGGTNLGSAEVAFAENGSHAGMNLAVVGSDVVANLIGYAVPHPGWCSGMCASGARAGGPFGTRRGHAGQLAKSTPTDG